MLFEILTVVLALYVMATPILYAKAIKFGVRLAESPVEALPELDFHVPKKKEKPKMTPDEDRTYQILGNIDRYDGTSVGQRKVQVNGQQ